MLKEAVPLSQHALILKLSPDYDHVTSAWLAEDYGVAMLMAIDAVKGLRWDPDTGCPLLKNGYGGITGRAIKPIGLRVVSELREAGIRLPIIASAGIRTFDDYRESFWAETNAVSLGSEIWLAPLWGYVLGPLRGLRIRHLISQIEGYQLPDANRSGHRVDTWVSAANNEAANLERRQRT